MSPEPGLFVVWHTARDHADRILADLSARFIVRGAWRMHWTPRKVAENYRRFYSDIPIRGSAHRFNKGAGPFLAVVFEDPDPQYGVRDTTRGPREVNTGVLDAKLAYRGWGVPLGVHSTENAWEMARDITMLFGQGPAALLAGLPETWDGSVVPLYRDLAGAWGWADWRTALDTVCEAAPGVRIGGEGEPLTVLTTRYADLLVMLGARHATGRPPAEGGSFRVRVEGREQTLVVRHVEDGFLPRAWAEALVEGRVADPAGGYGLAPVEALAVRAYRARAHGPVPGDEGAWQRLGKAAGVDVPEAPDAAWLDAHLAGVAALQGVDWPRPRDLSVPWDHARAGHPRPALAAARDRTRGLAAGVVRAVRNPALEGWQHTRDRVLTAAPALRRLRRRGPA